MLPAGVAFPSLHQEKPAADGLEAASASEFVTGDEQRLGGAIPSANAPILSQQALIQ
jgi:hypothetical protein